MYAWSAASPHWACSLLVSALAATFSSLILRRTRVLDAAFPLRSVELTSSAFHAKRGGAESHAESGAGDGRRLPPPPPQHADAAKHAIRTHERAGGKSAELL